MQPSASCFTATHHPSSNPFLMIRILLGSLPCWVIQLLLSRATAWFSLMTGSQICSWWMLDSARVTLRDRTDVVHFLVLRILSLIFANAFFFELWPASPSKVVLSKCGVDGMEMCTYKYGVMTPMRKTVWCCSWVRMGHCLESFTYNQLLWGGSKWDANG